MGNTAPTAVIETPLDSLNWKVGDTISFSGRGDDPDAPLGTLPDSALSWQINILHCPGSACHTHFVSSFDGISGGSFTAPDHDFPSFLEVRLTATDPGHGLRQHTGGAADATNGGPLVRFRSLRPGADH